MARRATLVSLSSTDGYFSMTRRETLVTLELLAQHVQACSSNLRSCQDKDRLFMTELRKAFAGDSRALIPENRAANRF